MLPQNCHVVSRPKQTLCTLMESLGSSTVYETSCTAVAAWTTVYVVLTALYRPAICTKFSVETHLSLDEREISYESE